MQATSVTKFAYECERCNEIHRPSEEVKPVKGYLINTDDYWDSENGVTLIKPIEAQVYPLDCEERQPVYTAERPDQQEAWECNNCGTVFLTEDEAESCCEED